MLISAQILFVLLVLILLFFFCADFHHKYRCSVYESEGEVFKFTIVATHKINVVGKS